MKKIVLYILLTLGGLSAVSCNDWLDVRPSDSIEAEDLFAEGTGYRNALNGVYRQVSSGALFGRELTYGMVEAMAQVYNSGTLHVQHEYQNFFKYDYTVSKAKGVIAPIWETAYNAIANCNNIIVMIPSEPDSKFKFGRLEKELILGEALALRAFLHFQMACYFAPAPVKNPTGAWIPYYDTFPQTTAAYLSVNDCLERCVEDLKAAKAYVKQFDTYATAKENNASLLNKEYRFFVSNNAYDADADIFINYRGYRMNYLAVTAILARVCSYAGKYDLAAAEAQEVIDFKFDGTYYALQFASEQSVEASYKLVDDLIFSLNDEELQTNYKAAMNREASLTLALNSKIYSKLFDCASDYRKTKMLNTSGRTTYPLRYSTPRLSNGFTPNTLRMLPIIRLSELYYIKAEAQAAAGNYTGATQSLDAVRYGRSCPLGELDGKISDPVTFKNELLKEIRREFVQEGLTFYYYKKYDEKFDTKMTDQAWYLPYPDSETIH